MRTSAKVVFTLQVVLLGLIVFPAAASATVHYLRPNGTDFTSKPWSVFGATTFWDALNDEVTESETPSASDYIYETQGSEEARVTLGSMNILGVSVTKAQIWYYAANNQPLEVRSSADTTWRMSNTAGWNSFSQIITSQLALDELSIRFRTNGSTATPRQIRAAFLKIETNGPKIYWGAWMDGDVYKATNPGLTDAPWNQTTWDLFEAHTQKPVSIVHFGQLAPWQQSFASEPLEKARTREALPLMDMGTGCLIGKVCKSGETVEEEEKTRVSLSEINEGKYDSYYEKWAADVAAYKYPFFFRWAWEMNGTWFKWGRDAAKDPNEYVKAWRRLHGIAESAGATNITWVWCPNVEFLGGTPYGLLYPGDAYVDWTCLDGYNKANRPFFEVFGSSYSAIADALAPSKPLMIGETATVHGIGHSSHLEWFRDALRSLPTRFPKIKAFVWFNWNIVEGGKEWEWPIEWTAGGQKVFAEEIASPYFAGSEFGEPDLLQPIKPLP
jgi:hypothetical protein